MKEKNKNLIFNNSYNLPEEKEKFLDLDTQEIVDSKNLTPLQIIQITAKKLGYEVKPPNKNCRKKGCYGRGYIGWDSTTKAPIPCSCIFLKEQIENLQNPFMNRKTQRLMKQDIKRRFKKLKKNGKLQKELEKIKMETSSTNIETSGVDNG